MSTSQARRRDQALRLLSYCALIGTWMTRQLVVGDAPGRVIGLPVGHIRDHPDNHPRAAHYGYPTARRGAGYWGGV